MKNIRLNCALILISFCLSSGLSMAQNKANDAKKGSYPLVLISTNFGDIKIKLYNQTPLHSDNFIKLINEKYFDSLLFHRVINSFMIQGGDPNSKNALPGKALGEGGPAYTIPAEFVDTLFHKKGVLAAARQGDNVNPKKESSGSQFYLVQGKVATNQELDNIEARINQQRMQVIFNELMMKPEWNSFKQNFIRIQQSANQDSLQMMIAQVTPAIESELNKGRRFKYTEQQRKAYTTIGGTPFLDQNYTVFGEVIQGLDVIDKIAALNCDGNNRPLQDVIMKITLIKK